jgi:hypothetical protein
VNTQIDGNILGRRAAKELMEAKRLRGIPGGCDDLVSEIAEKQEPQSEGTHQKASEGKAEQEAVAETIRDR